MQHKHVVGNYHVQIWSYNAQLGITACKTIMYKINCTIPSREQVLADYRVEEQSYKWQPTRSLPWAAGVPGAVRRTVDYRGSRGLPQQEPQTVRLQHTEPANIRYFEQNAVCKCTANLANGLFPSGFRIKSLYAFLLSPIPVTCPAHLLLLDLIARLINGILNQNINM